MIHKLILAVHVVCGALALIMGIIPLVMVKGSTGHIRSGRLYSLAMYGVSLTTFLLFLLEPSREFLQFLVGIAVLGFYLTFTGNRAAKHRYSTASRPDRVVAAAALGIGLLMASVGALKMLQAFQTQGSWFYGIVYMIFGLATGSAARADLLLFRAKKESEKWLSSHIIRMLSAYIATLTAFCVVNIHFLPPLLVWTAPGVLGGILIGIVVARFSLDKRFASP